LDDARQSTPKFRIPRGTAEGVAAWAVFAVVAVSLRGIRWDEDYEFAQVITRAVAYPEGHPVFVFVLSVANIQVYGAAALYALTGSAEFVCAVRNILFLAATVLPSFLLGTLMAGRSLCGHAAAVFVLLGTHLNLDGNHPLQTWGHFFSNGHVGMGCALAGACLVTWRRYLPGCLLAGLMPCIHLGQSPALLGLAAIHALAAAYERRWRDFATCGAGLAIGLAACGLFVLATGAFHAHPPTTGAYAAQDDIGRLWTAFIEADAHRATPSGGVSHANANLALLLFLLFALAASHVERYRRDFQPWRWMFVYGGIAIMAVWGAMTLHAALGPRMPNVLLAWMPNRMSNHVVMLLTAGLPAIVTATDPLRGGRVAAGLVIMIGTLFVAITAPVTQNLLPAAVHSRLVASGGEGLFFFLYGAAATLLHAALRDDKPFRARWTVAAFGTLIVVAMHHRFGAACILAGVIARVGVDRFLRHTPRWHETLQLAATRGYALGTAVAVTLAALLVQQGRDQAWLPRTPFEQNVAMYLSNRGQPDTMIVTRPDQYAMQARLGHPVMANLALPTWPLGRPSLGPPIAKLYREIYGIHFGNGRPARQNWATVWRNRSREEWQDLAAAHGFRYVLAPNHVAVRLPAVLIGETESLYEAWANGSP